MLKWRVFKFRQGYKMNQCTTKPTKWPVRPAKTQISLGMCPVWSVFAVHLKKCWVLSYPLSTQRRLWSDWVDAQADLSLCWAAAHRSFCWFCHAVAQTISEPILCPYKRRFILHYSVRKLLFPTVQPPFEVTMKSGRKSQHMLSSQACEICAQKFLHDYEFLKM